MRSLSMEEKLNLRPDKDGTVRVGTSGIFNKASAAVRYTSQHNAKVCGVMNDLINDETMAGHYATQHHGDREGQLCLLHFPGAAIQTRGKKWLCESWAY
ncbi:hypothetical protein [Paraburkholderia megapolitana]|uniref:Uncharacterized protein n=1 Tax=Paraburkholderia megapolitana TaxID=420953 RepID=A0A1I3LNZ7_9BURK|nr:hypothetical protein [Paraburkholderia megapolitana]QDQ80792.1 hypothetical protein FNZ07_06175 [Paraburkholderia megapolitana]SFI86206.1 hypothetical protein SAMN05192543_104503 [Paraburkholderia megapolitana]